ncbi:hypothetical protein [Streptomyces sp. NPDC090798]
MFQTLHHVDPFTLGRVPAQAFKLFMNVDRARATSRETFGGESTTGT